MGETDQLGTVNVGKTATLYVEWDKANNQFVFKVNTLKKTLSQAVGYGTFSTVNPPVWNVKRLDAVCYVPGSTSSRGYALIDAFFDNVYYK